MYETCPHKYKILIVDKLPISKEKMDHGYITQGSVPHDLAEVFFKLPIPERKLSHFLDNFEHCFSEFVKTRFIDMARHGSLNAVKEATLRAVRNQILLIQQLGLAQFETSSEEKFKVVVTDDLEFGGRIDLIVHIDPVEKVVDLYDWKATNNTNPDQMYFYIAAMIKRGFKVRKAAFLLLKECRPRKVKVDPVVINRLFSAVRHAGQLIDKGCFQPLFNRRMCEYCEAGNKCSMYQAMLANRGKIIPSGLVSFE